MYVSSINDTIDTASAPQKHNIVNDQFKTLGACFDISLNLKWQFN
jgi:hypothetical protein